MKFYIITIGCTLNKSESQRMRYLLEKEGFKYVENPKEAEIIIINTCTVKTPSENKTYRFLREFRDKKIILTGCLVQHQPEKFKEYSTVGIYEIEKIVDAVKRTINNEIVKYLEIKKVNKLEIPSIDEYPIKIVPIQEGCLWKCKYCATKLARCLTFSYPPEIIFNEIFDALKKGLKIIYFTGTDLAIYGFDLGINLADLLFRIREIDGDFYIRVGMANPGILNGFLSKLLEAYNHNKIFKFFHIPVQSASNKVLESMGRLYKIEDFYEIVEKIRKKYFEASISTDIIVGYPTETEEDFRLTCQMIEEIKFDVINLSKFWPRPKTEAYKMKYLKGEIVKNRSRIIKNLFNKTALERNKIWRGWEGYCIVESKGKGESWICRNYSYKQIIVKTSENILGKIIKVKVSDITPIDLRADIIDIVKDPYPGILEEKKLF
ncbi:MAG: tRNA (N(6)-L-threonylcarbamoyladenosine(37)-C(2))-methylthiotransferase [Candidatus Aenigmatarchaeota archaeon]